ncbi:vesicular glutamate transporter 1-like isoform X2 [Cimex lectularius]|uniref:Major facilitator superfamily (MFS) profile domain-containing protein n=1 Tax=Cimex lectularius TaxID=79782 RepID=A0A8I6RAX2_CIMLE|nr:vesicular glutamate transporter 1-like isoform X2 [Cimex lectularius]
MVCKQQWGTGVRHIQILLLFLCLTTGTILSSSHVIAVQLARETEADSSTYFEDTFKMEKKTLDDIISLEFMSFYVFFISRFLSGIICCKVNNKVYLMLIMLLYSIQSYSLPSFAETSGWSSMISMRILVGILDGLLMPVILQIATRWRPFPEYSRCIATLSLGPFCGKLIVTALISFIGRSIGGWSSVFYISGNLGILWVVAWFTFGADEPRSCFYVSTEEELLISRLTTEVSTLYWDTPIPWKGLFKSKSMYVAIAMELMTAWTTVFITESSYMSIYMKEVQGYSEDNVGIAFNYMSMIVLTPILCAISMLCDWIIGKEMYPVIHQRKTCSSIGLWGSAICIVFIGYAENSRFILFTYYLYLAMQSFVFVSYSLLPFDVAPNFSGLINAISTSVGSIPIMFLPSFVKLIVIQYNQDVLWNYMFYLASLSYFSANFIYTILYEGKLEEFNNIKHKDVRSHSSKSTYHEEGIKWIISE